MNKYPWITANVLAQKLQENFPNREDLHDLPADIQKALSGYHRNAKQESNTQ